MNSGDISICAWESQRPLLKPSCLRAAVTGTGAMAINIHTPLGGGTVVLSRAQALELAAAIPRVLGCAGKEGEE